jgi:hypothetical protein
MYIANGTNHNYRYLKLMDRVPTLVNGKMVQRAKLILNIGPLSRFDDHKPNYVRRLRESFKRGEPLIDLLKPYCANVPPPDMTKVPDDGPKSNPRSGSFNNIGYLYLEALYSDLVISDILTEVKSRAKIGHDLNGVAKMLITKTPRHENRRGGRQGRGDVLLRRR